MSADATHAERWRNLEAEARAIASTMTDPEPRRVMLFIAEGYNLLPIAPSYATVRKNDLGSPSVDTVH